MSGWQLLPVHGSLSATAHAPNPYHGFGYPAEVILWALRWYLAFPISYPDLAAMLADRGVIIDHTTLFRWV